MRQLLSFRAFIYPFIFLLIALSCNIPDSITKNERILSGTRIAQDSLDDIGNYKQFGELVYTKLKYYATTYDPYKFIPDEMRDSFVKEFESSKKRYDDEHWTYQQTINYLKEQKFYSERQAIILLDEHKQLLDFIQKRPTSEDFAKWSRSREQDLLANTELSADEKSQVLYQRITIHYAVQYRLDMMPDEAKGSKSVNNGQLRTSACGFWETLSCWVGYVSGISSLSSQAGSIAGVVFHASAKFVTNITGIGAAIGVVVGAVQAIQGCSCDMNYCSYATGADFPYECYTYGNPLNFQVWGYGNVSPSSFEFQFYSNNNLNNSNNFFGNFASVDNITIPGNKINTSIQTVALKSNIYCDGSPKTAFFGWYDLTTLGKPNFAVSGQTNFTVSQVSHNVYAYTVTGMLGSSGVNWSIQTSGYPGASANGVFNSPTNSNTVLIQWNSTPGIAYLKATSTASCGSMDQYLRIQITP